MLDETRRQQYLSAMGVTQWKLRATNSQSVGTNLEKESDEDITQVEEITPEKRVQIPCPNKPSIVSKGLHSLNQESNNGLLVVLPGNRKELSPESRLLMSKMLKAIHFLPSETAFAATDEDQDETVDTASEPYNLDSIKVILVLGYEAGRQLVRLSGARIIPGTENYILADRKIVVSLHPDELHDNPEYKQRAWSDLQQLVEFYNTTDV